jgi:hypothetical protein
MEMVGLVLAMPMGFVAAAIYTVLATRIVLPRPGLTRLFVAASWVVLAVIACEIILLATIGAVRSHDALGGFFTVPHVVGFLLGTPAAANLLALRLNRGWPGRWYVVASICAIVAFACVMLNISVDEAINGIQ